MRFQFARAADAAVIPHVMVWGDSGVGKTACSVMAEADLDFDFRGAARGSGLDPIGDESVLLLTGEPNAIETVRSINPKCAVIRFDTWKQAEELLAAAVDGEFSRAGFSRLAIDGLTELQRQLIRTMDREADGFWNELLARTQLLFHTIRSIPMPVVVTGLSGVRLNDKTKVEYVTPLLELKTAPGHALSTLAAAGRATKAGEGDSMRYCVDFTLPPRFLVKESGSLTGRVKPCAGAWLAVLERRLSPEAIRFGGDAVETEKAPSPVDATGQGVAGAKGSARKVQR